MQELTYAIVGCGGVIATSHINALKQTPGAKLVAMTDVKRQPGQQRAEENNCDFFTDYRKMLTKKQPNVVVVCVPHPLHPQVAMDSVNAGAHVLVEKPIAVSVADADAMIRAAHKAKRWLAVSFQQRYRSVIQKAKQLIDAGELGSLVRVFSVEPWFRTAAYYKMGKWRATWKGEGGGVLMNQSPHTLDMVCYLAGQPKKVWGWTRTMAHKIEVEDTFQAMLEFENGAPGYITASTFESSIEKRLQLVGEKAVIDIIGETLTVHRFSQPLRQFLRECPEPFKAPATTAEHFDLSDNSGGHIAAHMDLREAILENRPPAITGEDARMSLELANAIILSGHTDGKPVTMPLSRAAYSKMLAKLQGE